MSFPLEIKRIRERIIHRVLFTASIFVSITLIPSMMRVLEIGFQIAFFFHIGAALVFIALYLFRKSISLNFKAHAFLSMALIVPIVGLINFRISGAAYLFSIALIISLIIYGIRVGLIYAVVFTIAFIIIGYLHVNGLIPVAIDFNLYTSSQLAWTAIITGYIFYFIVLIDILSLYYNLFIKNLRESWGKTEELEENNKKLLMAEKRYRSLFEGSNDGIVLVDKNSKIRDCNQSYLDLLGYKLDDLVGRKYSITLTDQTFNWDDFFNHLSRNNGVDKVAEVEAKHKGGSIIPVEVTPHKIENDSEVYLWGVIRDLRKIKKLEKQVFSTMIRAEEKERERYAKELHDGLGPLLSTSLIYVNAIEEEEDDSKVKEYLKRAYEIIKEATYVVREISNNLSPVILTEYGISQAIRAFIEKAHMATSIKFSINDESTCRLSQVVESTIYRTLVELVNNSIKHSDAENVVISLKFDGHKHIVKFEDDGVGFEYQKTLSNNKGFGLLNLENRIKKIGGKYHFHTASGKGVKVLIELKNIGND